MRGDDRQPDSMFSYVSPAQRVPPDHPLRAMREFVDEATRGADRGTRVNLTASQRPDDQP